MGQFTISDHCRWVKGANGSAIYDLLHNRVFSVDPNGTQLISTMINGGLQDPISSAFVGGLIADGLINDHSSPIPDPKVVPRLDYVWLELTSKCNCSCLHCYGGFGSCDTAKPELSFDDWRRVLDMIVKNGGTSIQFIGGEPLLFPHFIELLKYAKHVGIKRIDVFTNATLLNSEIADALSEACASVRISLYGGSPSEHDAVTKHKGSFLLLDHGIDLLQEKGIPVSIAVVLMRENQDHLESIKEYINGKGLKFNGFDIVRPVTYCEQESHAVTDIGIASQRIMHKPSFRTSAYTFSRNRKWNSCWFGKFAVTSNGDIIPCIFARDQICGNVKNDRESKLRDNLLKLWGITKDDIDTCKDCEFRYACDDCRPLSSNGDCGVYSKYPRCTYDPYSCEWKNGILTDITL